jgi:hypothetical protein
LKVTVEKDLHNDIVRFYGISVSLWPARLLLFILSPLCHITRGISRQNSLIAMRSVAYS